MERSYICPHCGARTSFVVYPVAIANGAMVGVDTTYDTLTGTTNSKMTVLGNVTNPNGGPFIQYFSNRFVTSCLSCEKFSYWENGQIKYPLTKGILASKDMPPNAAEFFREAQDVISLSPRAACALLRICLEILVNYAGEDKQEFDKSKPLYDRINKLGVSSDILELLHACRVAGNEFSHPGVINLKNEDTPEIAHNLSELINALVGIWIAPTILAKKLKKQIGKS